MYTRFRKSHITTSYGEHRVIARRQGDFGESSVDITLNDGVNPLPRYKGVTMDVHEARELAQAIIETTNNIFPDDKPWVCRRRV